MSKREVLSILKEYKGKYKDEYGILELGLFGSVAREEDDESSDVDICIKTVNPDPFILVHIKEDIEERVKRNVDIVRIRNRMNDYLKQRIQNECIYV